MHGIIAIGIALSIELLVLIASMHLWSKAKGTDHGKLYNWITNLIVLGSILLILGTITAGICRHCCKGMGECKEIRIEKRMHGGMGDCKMMSGDCDDMPCCKSGMKGECGEMNSGHGGNMENCPYDKNGKCIGDESKCKEMMKDKDGKDGKAVKDTTKKMDVKK